MVLETTTTPISTSPAREHKIALGGHEGAAETEARKIFREFTADEILATYGKLLENEEDIISRLKQRREMSDWFGVGDVIANPHLEALYQKAPQLFTLHEIIRDTFAPNRLVVAFLDRFNRLIDKELTFLQMIDRGVLDPVALGTQSVLETAFILAFTEPQKRPTRLAQSLRPHEYERLRQHLPDLSQLNSPKEILDQLTSLLTLTHAEALQIVCTEQNIDPKDLPALKESNPTGYKSIFASAGEYFAKHNINAIITDVAGAGADSMLKVHPATHQGEQHTDRGQCPAGPLINAYFEGVGRVLKQQREHILKAMEWDAKKA